VTETSIIHKNTESENIRYITVVLTYKKDEALAKLLPSLLYQDLPNFEVVIVDNGCLLETKQVIGDAFLAFDSSNGTDSEIPHKYLHLCDNPGHATGNNAGVKLASPTSEYILFLNDDIVLSKPSLVQTCLPLLRIKRASCSNWM
jgi:GT2 family glycosyltransferase